MSIRIDIAFTLDPEWDCPSKAIMDCVDYILMIEGEFPGLLGEHLEVYQRVRRGRFTGQDILVLHNAEEVMREDYRAYSSAVEIEDDAELTKTGRISTAVTAAIELQEVFLEETAGKVSYHAEEGTTNIFNLLTKKNEEAAKKDGSALGLFSGRNRWTR